MLWPPRNSALKVNFFLHVTPKESNISPVLVSQFKKLFRWWTQFISSMMHCLSISTSRKRGNNNHKLETSQCKTQTAYHGLKQTAVDWIMIPFQSFSASSKQARLSLQPWVVWFASFQLKCSLRAGSPLSQTREQSDHSKAIWREGVGWRGVSQLALAATLPTRHQVKNHSEGKMCNIN